jgi:hypothetical protein
LSSHQSCAARRVTFQKLLIGMADLLFLTVTLTLPRAAHAILVSWGI